MTFTACLANTDNINDLTAALQSDRGGCPKVCTLSRFEWDRQARRLLTLTTIEWRHLVGDDHRVRVGVVGGPDHLTCGCLILACRILLQRSLDQNDPRPLAGIENGLRLAIGAARQVIVEVTAPSRPDWLPNSN
jgi:hypothetical protein